MELNKDTEAGQIAALALEGGKSPCLIPGPDGRTFAAVPKDIELREVTSLNAAKTLKPDTIKQTPALQTAASLITYVDRFKASNTILFADIDDDRIVAAIDYHGQTVADLVAHRATLTLPRSLAWQKWDEIDGQLLSQLDFARFIDEYHADFITPKPADLLELVNNIQAVETVDFRAKTKINSDNVDFDLAVTTEAFSNVEGRKLTIPTRFTIKIPVYFGEEARELEVRLRHKKSQSEGLKLGVVILNKEEIRQDEFKAVVDRVAAATNLTSVYGRLA